MSAFLSGLASAFDAVIQTTLQATVLAALILILQRLLRKRLAPRWHYALWLLVLARLFLPWTPESPTSVFNYVRTEQATPTQLLLVIPDTDFEQFDGPPEGGPLSDFSGQSLDAPPDVAAIRLAWTDWLRLLWLGVATLLVLYVSAVNSSLWWRVRREPAIDDGPAAFEFAACKEVMGVRDAIRLVRTSRVSTPALLGLLRPRLLLPESMERALSREDLRHVFLHELAHYRRGDLLVNWLMVACNIVHWFNPALWYAFHRMRADREIACDALAMSHIAPEDTPSYGRTLLRLLEHVARPRPLPGLVGVLERKSHLKKRIRGIAGFRPGSYRWSILAVVLIAVLSAVALTNASTQESVETQTLPSQNQYTSAASEAPSPAAAASLALPPRAIGGTVTDAEGNPVSGAWVEWGYIYDTPEKRQRTCTGPEGRYSLTTTRYAHGFRLGVTKSGYAPQWYDIAPPHLVGDLKSPDEYVFPPQTKDFALQPAHDIRGVVVDTQGNPIPGVAVTALTSAGGYYSSFSMPSSPTLLPGTSAFTTSTSEDGTFALEGLPSGEVTLRLQAPHRHVNDGNYKVDEPCRIMMHGSGKAGIVQARAIDGVSGLPIPSYRVTRRHVASEMAVENSEGVFVSDSDLTAANDYEFHVYAEGYLPWSGQLNATEVTDSEVLSLSLTPGPLLKGILVNGVTGEPIPNGALIYGVMGETRRVEWGDWDRYIDGYHGLTSVQRATSGTDGVFQFSEDPDHPGALFARAPGYARAILPPVQRVAVDSAATVRFALFPEASILGTVLRDGVPQPGAIVHLSKTGADDDFEHTFEFVTADANGKFAYMQLASGDYSLAVQDPFTGITRDGSAANLLLAQGERREVEISSPTQPAANALTESAAESASPPTEPRQDLDDSSSEIQTVSPSTPYTIDFQSFRLGRKDLERVVESWPEVIGVDVLYGKPRVLQVPAKFGSPRESLSGAEATELGHLLTRMTWGSAAKYALSMPKGNVTLPGFDLLAYLGHAPEYRRKLMGQNEVDGYEAAPSPAFTNPVEGEFITVLPGIESQPGGARLEVLWQSREREPGIGEEVPQHPVFVQYPVKFGEWTAITFPKTRTQHYLVFVRVTEGAADFDAAAAVASSMKDATQRSTKSPAPPSPDVIAKLNSPISLEFEGEHLAAITAFMASYLGLSIELDTQVIAPQGSAPTESAAYATDGIVPYVKLADVPFKDALKALLRPLGLDYDVRGDTVYISTPARLAAP
ncbi:MAG: carboxypeptidase regulatory-like domain-containing protein [Candidatus Hydrogenedentes bacterium]|nr:carboxypeptidase regulatory-like domain-containing protein [Candidatus Hydrogenedentota bacterium]